jgi:hypothetical protein
MPGVPGLPNNINLAAGYEIAAAAAAAAAAAGVPNALNYSRPPFPYDASRMGLPAGKPYVL